MPALSIANVRLSIRLMEDSVQPATASMAISRRRRIRLKQEVESAAQMYPVAVL